MRTLEDAGHCPVVSLVVNACALLVCGSPCVCVSRLGEVCSPDQSSDKQQGCPAAAGPQRTEGRECSQALAPGRGKGGQSPPAFLPGGKWAGVPVWKGIPESPQLLGWDFGLPDATDCSLKPVLAVALCRV